MTETINNLKESLIQTIKSGSVKQKPKWYFVLFSIFSALGIICVFTLLLYIVSFITLVFGEEIRFQGGVRFFALIHALPIILILLIIILLCVLFVLIHHYRFSYQKPLLYSIVGIFLVTTIVTIGLTTFDEEMRFARMGENSTMPVIRIMHTHYRPHHRFPAPPPPPKIIIINE